MKKLTAVFLSLLLLLTGCGCRPANLMESVPARTVCLAEQPDKRNEATAFALKLFQNSLEEGENTLISPLSVLASLGMTANGAKGETLAQMEETFGMSTEDINAYLYSYMDGQTAQLKLANSIWFSDDDQLNVKQSFLETNADFYQADIFQTAFNAETRTAINDWVKEKTDGMIPEILDDLPADAVMYLVNALAFEAEWMEPYRENQVRESTFTKEDRTVQAAELMYSTESRYLEDENAVGFLKYYSGGRYAFAALLPREGLPVAEYVQTLTGAHLQEILDSAEEVTVNAAIPKFEVEYGREMKDILQAMGMTDAFDREKADFTGIPEDGGLFIGRVLHETAITVAEQGTKAGAATVVEMREGSMIQVDESKTVTLDRPFVYMLIDCEQNLPFFLGTMMDVGGEICGYPQETTPAPEPLPSGSSPSDLQISCGDAFILSGPGSYTWTMEEADGTGSTAIACGAAPTDDPERLPLLEASEAAASLIWDIPPDTITAQCWADAGSPAETAAVEGSTLQLMPGTCIYEITAVWEQGTASYAFRASAPTGG